MGRTTKQGIDYFSLDVQFDDKTELYLLETEAIGLSVMITLWQLIYQNEGYFITNSEDLRLLIKRRINVSINNINECINAMLRRGIFDNDLCKKHNILTSKAIQKRYFDAAKRKKEVRVVRNFILTNLDQYENLVDVNINGIDVGINAIDVGINATKEKEKEKEKELKASSRLSNGELTVNEQLETSASTSDKIPYQEIINYLNEKTSKSFRHTSKETQTLIKAKIKAGFTVDNFFRVIDNKVAKWLLDPKMAEYLRPQTLFGTKFESYLNDTIIKQKEKSSW